LESNNHPSTLEEIQEGYIPIVAGKHSHKIRTVPHVLLGGLYAWHLRWLLFASESYLTLLNQGELWICRQCTLQIHTLAGDSRNKDRTRRERCSV